MRTSLLLMKPSFKELELYYTIASLSYIGDPRMLVGENPKKVISMQAVSILYYYFNILLFLGLLQFRVSFVCTTHSTVGTAVNGFIFYLLTLYFYLLLSEGHKSGESNCTSVSGAVQRCFVFHRSYCRAEVHRWRQPPFILAGLLYCWVD